MDIPALSPGTVSKILWHFTGGPRWNQKLRKQSSRPKPSIQAYDALKKILRSKTLRVGGYREFIRMQTPKKRRRRPDGSYEYFYGDPVELESSKVCCLADIPIQHLAYHARRYGRFAIGFHRDMVLDHAFNPVLYAPEDSFVIDDLYQVLMGLIEIEANAAAASVERLLDQTARIQDKLESEADKLANSEDAKSRRLAKRIERLARETDQAYEGMQSIDEHASNVENSLEETMEAIERAFAFMKSFSHGEFGTIYCEREWRSLDSYVFDFKHVAMIVLPKRVGNRNYFEDFVTKQMKTLKVPSYIPVVPWEDLVDH